MTLLDTAKGRFGIYVDSSQTSSGLRTRYLRLILEQNPTEETFVMRRLDLRLPDDVGLVAREQILRQMKNWIELDEGDGFLDCTNSHA